MVGDFTLVWELYIELYKKLANHKVIQIFDYHSPMFLKSYSIDEYIIFNLNNFLISFKLKMELPLF